MGGKVFFPLFMSAKDKLTCVYSYLQIKNLVKIEAGHITYYRIDVLKEEFQSIMTEEDREDEVPFSPGKLASQLLSRSRNAKADEKAELSEQYQSLQMSEKDKKHIIILGKLSYVRVYESHIRFTLLQ